MGCGGSKDAQDNGHQYATSAAGYNLGYAPQNNINGPPYQQHQPGYQGQPMQQVQPMQPMQLMQPMKTEQQIRKEIKDEKRKKNRKIATWAGAIGAIAG